MAGTIAADTLTHSTAGSIATNYVVEGSAKVWVNFTGITTTASRDSFNVSSLTDDTTGRTTISISSSMANGNYTGSWFNNGSSTGAYDSFGNAFVGNFAPRAAGSYSVYAFSSGAIDAFHNDSIVFGDLA